MSVTGALQTDITPFEKALRVRQLALSTVQRSVAEDRIARANKTRTQQIDLGELVPGVTRVDFHGRHKVMLVGEVLLNSLRSTRTRAPRSSATKADPTWCP